MSSAAPHLPRLSEKVAPAGRRADLLDTGGFWKPVAGAVAAVGEEGGRWCACLKPPFATVDRGILSNVSELALPITEEHGTIVC